MGALNNNSRLVLSQASVERVRVAQRCIPSCLTRARNNTKITTHSEAKKLCILHTGMTILSNIVLAKIVEYHINGVV